MALVLGIHQLLQVVIHLVARSPVDVLAEEGLEALDAPWQLHILVVHGTRHHRHVLADHVGNLLLSQRTQVTLVAAEEIVLLALDDSAHGVEQGLLALLEHLDEHAGALVGILNLFLLLGLLYA